MAKAKKGGLGLDTKGKGRDPIRHKYKKTSQGNSRNSKKKRG